MRNLLSYMMLLSPLYDRKGKDVNLGKRLFPVKMDYYSCLLPKRLIKYKPKRKKPSGKDGKREIRQRFVFNRKPVE